MTENKMTFLEQLQSHKGGLLQLKTQLYWYGARGWDNTPGRICLILNATAVRSNTAATVTTTTTTAAAAVRSTATTLLLIDGSPQWIWIAEQDTEVLNDIF